MGTTPESLFTESVMNSLFDGEYAFSFSRKATDRALERLETILHTVCADFSEKETRRILIETNDLAAIFPEMITEEDLHEAGKQFLANFREGQYPVLFRKMKTAFNLFLKNTRLMADRLSRDQEEIERVLLDGKEFCEVSDLIYDARQSLYGSTCTTVIIVTDAGKIIYKPHDCTPDFCFHDLNLRFFSRIFKTPKVVKGGYDYGFCEFITNRAAETEEEAARFYENMGGLTAVLCFTQGRDCHIKNILTDRAFPVPIDLEMIVSPCMTLGSFSFDKDKGLEDFRRSVALRGILPCQADEGNEYSPLLNTEDEQVCCAPVVNGERQTVFAFQKQFTDGFENTFRYCMSVKDQLLAWAEQLGDAHVRVIYGQKQMHSKISDYLNRYSALLSEDAQEKEAEKYSENLRSMFHSREVCNECVRVDAMGELPYFYAEMRSRSLLSPYGTEIKDYYAETPLASLKKTVSGQNESFLTFNLELIKKSLSDCLVKEQGIKKALPAEVTLDRRVDDLFIGIRDHFVQTPSGASLLIGQVRGNSVGLAGNPGTDGKTGIALFLKAYSVYHEGTGAGAEARRLSSQLIREADSYIAQTRDTLQPGDCEGLSGTLKCALLMNRMGKSPECESLIRHVCRMVSELDPDKILLSDKYAGLSGLISVYCRFEELPDREKTVVRLADRLLALKTMKYGDTLLWDTSLQKKVLSGAGHGMAGIFQALFLAYRLTGREEYEKAALDAWRFEEEVFREKLGTWPDFRIDRESETAMHGFCSGAPGIGSILVSLYEWRDSIPNYGKNLSRAIKSCMDQGILYRDHLCCGNGANADFMIDLYNITGKEEYLEKAKSLLVTGKEYAFLPPDCKNTFVNGLYFGAAGVGYELLRICSPHEIPSCLI